MKKALSVLALVVLLAHPAFAQKGKGGGGGGGRGPGPGIHWFEDFEEALKVAGEKNRNIFVFVHPGGDTKEPAEFNGADLAALSRDSWVFFKIVYDKDNELIRTWRVPSAPMCLGLDCHGNDFNKINGNAAEQIRAILKELPPMIKKYEDKLRSDLAKLAELMKSKESAKIGKALAEFLAAAKKGYKEVNEAVERSKMVEEDELKKVEAAARASSEAEREYLEDMANDYKGTPVGAEAELRMAGLDRRLGNVSAAIARLLKILKLEAPYFRAKVDAARKMLEEISSEGASKIAEAVTKTDKETAKELLRKIQKDYQGTEASKKAAEALKALE